MPRKRSEEELAQIAQAVRLVLASKPDQVWSVAVILRQVRAQFVLSPAAVEQALSRLARAGVVEPVRGQVHVGWRLRPRPDEEQGVGGDA